MNRAQKHIRIFILFLTFEVKRVVLVPFVNFYQCFFSSPIGELLMLCLCVHQLQSILLHILCEVVLVEEIY